MLCTSFRKSEERANTPIRKYTVHNSQKRNFQAGPLQKSKTNTFPKNTPKASPKQKQTKRHSQVLEPGVLNIVAGGKRKKIFLRPSWMSVLGENARNEDVWLKWTIKTKGQHLLMWKKIRILIRFTWFWWIWGG